MSKMLMAAVLVTSLGLALPLASRADSGHVEKAQSSSEGHAGGHEGHGGAVPAPASLAGAWSALTAARDAIAGDVKSGALEKIHAKAEPLPKLAEALLAQSNELDAAKRARVEGAVKQVERVAGALHVAADKGDAERTRKELSRLDGLLELIRAQYPAGALDVRERAHEGHSAVPGAAQGGHAHADRPAGVVESSPQATVHMRALDSLRFEPKRIEVQAGVPTRIELEKAGAAEHSLVVKTPDGTRDWVHLHAPGRSTEAATYRLDEPGAYPVLCTIPGHTEGGMVGELVVVAGQGPAHPHSR